MKNSCARGPVRSTEELDAEFFGITKLTKSMKKAREEIAEANAEVDKDQFTAAKHFDGERFPEGQQRVDTTGSMGSLNA